jgi:hypothetical protein
MNIRSISSLFYTGAKFRLSHYGMHTCDKRLLMKIHVPEKEWRKKHEKAK